MRFASPLTPLACTPFAAALAVVAGGCDAPVAAARVQLVVVVDTDAPLPTQAALDPALSDDATVDALRVDVFDASEARVTNFRDFVVGDPVDWPLSFGVVAPEGDAQYGSPVLLRIRLFRAKRASSATLEGQVVSEPPAAATIDRLVRIPFPAEGVKSVSIHLSFDCVGAPPSFEPGRFSTCIDGTRPSAPPGEGVLTDLPTTSAIGTSELAREVPCAGAPPGTVCIPGGFALLGDPDLVGLGENSEDTAPLHPTRIAPFALDASEMTVRQLRELAPLLESPLPLAPIDTLTASCNWTDEPADHEDLAVNCVTHETAEEACALAGARHGATGHLPSEAQWEFAARGRGKGWRFPWGDTFPGCCVAAVDRIECPVFGALQLPPRSHPASASCNGLGDVTPDGVFDLGGNLAEQVRDDYVDYTGECWSTRGVLRDPICVDEAAAYYVERGGDFFHSKVRLVSALRRKGLLPDFSVGFRCAYEVAP